MTERVYFAYAFLHDSWKVKIGYSQNVTQRIKDLRASYGTDVRLICDVSGDAFDEAALHMVMEHSLYRNEWFFPGKRMHALVSHIKETGNIPADIRYLGAAIRSERAAKRERVRVKEMANLHVAKIIKECEDWPFRNHEKIDRADIKCIPLASGTKSELANIGKQ